MKNPNGYGTIIKLGGKRRKPFAVMVTTGYTNEGKQVRKYVGYYETRKEAMHVLNMYNNNPYDIDNQKITFLEVMDKYLDVKRDKVSEKRIKDINYQNKHLQPIYNFKFIDLKVQNLQLLFDELSKKLSTGSLKLIKSNISAIYDYAIKIELVDKNLGNYIELPKHKKVIERKIFTLDEIELLKFESSTNQIAKILYVLIYTGFRINEILSMKLENIDLEKRILIGGSKTEAGKDRIVPIHPRIFEIVQEQVLGNRIYLFETSKNKKYLYTSFYELFKVYMKEKCMDHTIHDTRHTFATLLSEASSNKAAITKIIGHTNIGMTEHYVHTDMEKLRDEIEKIN